MAQIFVSSHRLADYKVTGNVNTSERTDIDASIVDLLVDSPFEKPSASVILLALDWRKKLQSVGFSDISAFPGYEGEILLSALKGEFCFEVTIEVDQSLSVSFERNKMSLFFEERLDYANARERLIEAARLSWILSGGFIRVISIPNRIGSQASLSKTFEEASLL